MQDPKPNYDINPSQRTPCILVLDASGSMSGRPIEELNKGLKVLEQELKNDPIASARVQIATISIGGEAPGATVIQDWVDAIDFKALNLKADYGTPLGEGMAKALDMVTQQKEILNERGISYTRPWIMMISDGAPTDDWRDSAHRCYQATKNKECLIFGIGVEGADMDVLSQFSELPPKKLAGLKFVELFEWLSTSLESVSRSAPEEAVQLASTDPWSVI